MRGWQALRQWGRRAGTAALASLSLILAGSLPAAEPADLRYGLLADFPPFQIWPEGAEPGGADLEMLRRIAPALGRRVRPIRYTDVEALERDLRAGRLDLASSMARTPEREAAFAWSMTYALIDQAVITRSDEVSGSLGADLAGRRLAVVIGYPSQTRSRDLFPLAQLVPVRSIAEGLRAVQENRADVLIEAQPAIVDLIERQRLTGLRIARSLALPSGSLHFVAPRRQAEMLASLSAALAGMDDATREHIVRSWSAEPQFVRRGEVLRLSDAERNQLAALPPLNVAVVGARLPFAAFDAEGRPQGLSVDVLRSMLGRLGVRIGQFRAATASEALGLMQRGEADLALGLQQATALSDALQFVGPYIEHPLVLLGRPEGSAWGLDQLIGRKLALPAVHFARPLIGARYPGIELVACDPLPACIDQVGRGEAEAVLVDVVTAALLLAETPRSDVQITGAVSGLRQEQSIAVSTRRAALLPLMQRALDATIADDLLEVKRRWLARPSPKRIAEQLLWRALPWVLAALALLFAAWWWHSSALRREVQRTRAAQARAEQARAASERFVTFLAHEVRNSLHSVIAGAELLRSARQVPPTVAASLGDSARSTLSLLNNLLDRDRLEAGRLSLHLEPARLEPLLRSVAVEMLPAALAKQLALQHDAPPHDPLLRIDALRVQQILRNLVVNAIKYSDEGGIVIEARCTPLPGAPARCAVEVRVRDQGPGIAVEDQARLFEPYFMVARGGAQAGSGLGLALCRDLARLMGGDLTIDSEPGRGTTATLAWEAEVEDASAGRAGGPPRSFLLVEDAEVYAMLLERALSAQGLPVTVAPSAARAGELLARGRYDVVLTDLNLGDGDAHAVIAAAEASSAGGPPPVVVVMSAELEDRQVRALREAGVQAVLKKTGDVGLFVRQLLQHPALQA